MQTQEDPTVVVVPPLSEALSLLTLAYGGLPVLLRTVLLVLVPRLRRLPPPDEPAPVYGPVGFVHFD